MSSKNIKYYVQYQNDGSYVVIEYNKDKNKKSIHSHHDTKEEAETEITSLYSVPSKAETLQMIQDIRDRLNQNK